MAAGSALPTALSELNTVVKRRYRVSVALLYPSTYQASLSSLALQLVYFYLNGNREIYAERVVLNVKEGLFSIETGRPLSRFDYVLVFSTYELDYPTAIGMLRRAGVSPLREARKEEDPVVVWGGPSPTANPWPLYHFADAVLRGEAEAFLDALASAMLEAENKRQFREMLGGLGNAWIPGENEQALIARVPNLDEAFFPIRQIQSLTIEPFLGRAFIVEPSRGCARGCRFCMEASVLGPRRERSFDKLARIIDEGVKVNSVDKVSFYSLSFFDSSLGDRLLELVLEKRLKASVPSVRADVLNERRVELIRMVGQRLVTIAPETPSEELQRKVGKRIPWDAVINVARWARKEGLSLKLYYMYGLPGESDDDLALIAKQVEEVYKVMGARSKVRITLMPFTPKPMTYMWREPMMGLKELKRRERTLKELLRRYARVDSYPPRHARLQYEINVLGADACDMLLRLSEKTVERAPPAEEARGLEELG